MGIFRLIFVFLIFFHAFIHAEEVKQSVDKPSKKYTPRLELSAKKGITGKKGFK
ncbi:MAG: hypothetical protein HRT87_03575, partial [Legionellales bacterium]|nr:hypothetical protein [Legionellales bacterium]